MEIRQVQRVKTISEYHRLRGLPKPEHPLISLVNHEDLKNVWEESPTSWVFDFYSIALKRNLNAKMRYGQQEYDFDEGVLFFVAPGQVISIHVDPEAVSHPSGYILLIHPDFLWGTPLSKGIEGYDFFDYSVHEALFLSDSEESSIIGLMQSIGREYRANIDRFTQDIIIAQLELLLNYADRFYHRQFITRQIGNHAILTRLEEVLTACFKSEAIAKHGLPTVSSIAEALCVSPNYLSNMLKATTGQSTQQHIHDKLIAKAKERLSLTSLSVGEIAYELGFEHPQSFSKLFKTKTALSPLAFRQSFN